jgi:carboxymethylenebutenolidase
MARLRPDGILEMEPITLTRRAALGAIGVGFALSTRPVMAATIITDTKGLVTADVKIPVADGHSPGYFARPEGKGPFPGVLIVSEIFGLHEHIRDLCRRMAKVGYAAVAPDYFYRAGDPSKETDFGKVFQIVAQAKYPQVMSDSQAAVDFLKSQPTVDGDRLAITGFCWGGTPVWMMCETTTDFKAGAAWYGRLAAPPPREGAPPPEDRPWPIDKAADLKAPVIGFYAGLDKGNPMSEIEAMRAALKKAKVKSEIIVYPDAQHAFNADYRPSYNEKDAKDAWAKMLKWFKDNGV